MEILEPIRTKRGRIGYGLAGAGMIAGAATGEYLIWLASGPNYGFSIVSLMNSVTASQGIRMVASSVLGKYIHVFTPMYEGLKSVAKKSYSGISSILKNFKREKIIDNETNYLEWYGLPNF